MWAWHVIKPGMIHLPWAQSPELPRDYDFNAFHLLDSVSFTDNDAVGDLVACVRINEGSPFDDTV